MITMTLTLRDNNAHLISLYMPTWISIDCGIGIETLELEEMKHKGKRKNLMKETGRIMNGNVTEADLID